MMDEYRPKPKVITFEADENLFAEFIAFKQARKDVLSLGYVVPEAHWYFYKPIRETEVTKILKNLIASLEVRLKSLEGDCNKYYYELKELREKQNKLPESKKKRWF